MNNPTTIYLVLGLLALAVLYRYRDRLGFGSKAPVATPLAPSPTDPFAQAAAYSQALAAELQRQAVADEMRRYSLARHTPIVSALPTTPAVHPAEALANPPAPPKAQ